MSHQIEKHLDSSTIALLPKVKEAPEIAPGPLTTYQDLLSERLFLIVGSGPGTVVIRDIAKKMSTYVLDPRMDAPRIVSIIDLHSKYKQGTINPSLATVVRLHHNGVVSSAQEYVYIFLRCQFALPCYDNHGMEVFDTLDRAFLDSIIDLPEEGQTSILAVLAEHSLLKLCYSNEGVEISLPDSGALYARIENGGARGYWQSAIKGGDGKVYVGNTGSSARIYYAEDCEVFTEYQFFPLDPRYIVGVAPLEHLCKTAYISPCRTYGYFTFNQVIGEVRVKVTWDAQGLPMFRLPAYIAGGYYSANFKGMKMLCTLTREQLCGIVRRHSQALEAKKEIQI